MFIDNEHTREYFELMSVAEQRCSSTTSRAKAKKLLGYVESHHIIPECMSGSDDKSNRAWLTAQEHLRAHLLLVEMVSDKESIRKMAAAAYRMTVPQSKNQQRAHDNIANIDEIRALAARLHGDYLADKYQGKNNPFYGKTHSVEHKAQLAANWEGDNNPMKDPEIAKKLSGDQHYSKKPEHIDTHRGKNNSRYNDTVRSWVNINTGETLCATRYEMTQRYPELKSNISSVITGKAARVKGWQLA
jgi:hypothetical protein